MQAAAFLAITPKSAGAHAAGALSLEPAKLEDAATGDAGAAFAQALAGLMGVAAGPTAPAVRPTTSDTGQAPGAKPVTLASSSPFAVTDQTASAPAPANGLAEAAPTSQAVTSSTATVQMATALTATVQLATALTATVQATTVQATTVQIAATPVTASPDRVAVPTLPPAAAAPEPALRPEGQSAAAPTLSSADQAAAMPPLTAPAGATTPVAFSALSFTVKLTGGPTTPLPSTAEQPTALLAVSPQLQPPGPPSDDQALANAPIASLTLTADQAAAALPTSAFVPVRATTVAPPIKTSTKPGAATAPAAETDQPAASDQPAAANPVVAGPPVIADGGEANSRTASDAPAPAAEAQSSSPADGGANALATGAAPPAPVQTAAALAAANGSAIVSQIATQVAKSFDGKSTRFDIALDPAGLGHVNVKVEIGAQGQVTAQLSFDNPHAAAEAKSQAGQLQQALEQAGFTVSQGGLSFDVGGQGAGFARQDAPAQPATAASLQTPGLTTTAASATLAAANSPRPVSGVDITI